MTAREAVLLAAGEGKRLRPLTLEVPKPLVPVAGVPMLERSLSALARAGVARSIVVAGHLAEVLRQRLRAPAGMTVEFVENPAFARTNSMYSLMLGLARVDGPCWVVEGDVVFEDAFLRVTPSRDIDWLVDANAHHLDGCYVTAEADGLAGTVEIVRDLALIPTGGGKSTGVLHASHEGVRCLREWLAADLLERCEAEYYDLVVGRRLPSPRVGVLDVAGSRWYEVDNAGDLARANALFA